MMSRYQSELQQFEEHGVTILPSVFSAEDMQPLILEVEAWVEQRAQKLFARGEIVDLHADSRFEQRYARLFEQSKNMGRGLDTMYMLGSALHEFLFLPNLIDALEPIIGKDVTCNPIQHLRAKPPAKLEGHERPGFHNVPWHQDAGVMMAEAEDSNIVTCWMPLSDVSVDMGCMRALPDCVQLGYLPHVGDGETRIDPERLPIRTPIELDCKKGDVVLLNRFTPHSSTPNRTNQCRWSLDLRYQTTGQHTGRTGHPEFEVKSSKQEVKADYEGWRNRWIDALKNPTGFTGHRIHQST